MTQHLQLITLLALLTGSLASSFSLSLIHPKTDFSNVGNMTISLLASSTSLNGSFINDNPYLVNQTAETMNRTGFCAVNVVPGTLSYYLQTFDTQAEAEEAGWKVTHEYKCGACSTLRDLAVYMLYPDLTAPVRKCGALAFIFGESLFFECLYNIGFTPDCAKIWYYNSKNTAKECLVPCMVDWVEGTPSNNANGDLSTCLECDETKSGPIFQRFAGRTRRDSGIVSSIERNSSEIFYVNHTYFKIEPAY